MIEFAQQTLIALAGVIILISLAMWLRAIPRWIRGEPLLATAPRRRVPWSWIDLLLIGVVGFVVLATSQWFCLLQFDLPAGGWELGDLDPSQQVGVLLAFSASSLATWLAALAICHWRSGATSRDLGWDAARWPQDIGLGIGCFVMLIVPVLAIHFCVQLIFPTPETHPFIDLIMKDPRIEYLLPIAMAALLAAPLVEEYFFRVLLQGWLERLMARREDPTDPSQDAGDGSGPEAEWADGAPNPSPGYRLDESPWASPYAQPQETDLTGAGRSGREACVPGALAEPPPGLAASRYGRLVPIGISAFAFALAHFGQGPAPISLFVLALGLGYVYQRTHRVLPCIVVHFLVNLTAVLQLALAIADNQS